MSDLVPPVHSDPESPQCDRHTLVHCDRFSVERVGYDDRQGTRRWKDVIRHPGAVVILPLLDDGTICLIRNRRVSVDETLLEVPAGTLDPGEDPAVCAHRELREETGYVAGSMEPRGWFYVSPGILDEKMFLFLATDLTHASANLMPDEDIENHLMPVTNAIAMAARGELHDAKTIVALLRLAQMNMQGGPNDA